MATVKSIRMACAVMVLCLVGTAAQAATRSEVAAKLEDYRQFFVDFQYAPDSAVPGDLLADCYGVIIMRQYKAGFVFGAKGGDGVIFMHDRYTGEWSAPAFVRSAEASFGFQAGGQAVDAIILIMNQAGVDMLLKTRFNIGVDASAAAGPVGRDLSAAIGAGTALLTYSRAKGLFAGASFEGGAMFNHDSFNEAMYGRKVGLRDILMDRRVSMPREAIPMINTLKSYAVRNTASPNPGVRGSYNDSGYRVDTYSAGSRNLDEEARRAAIAADNAARAAREAAKQAERAAERASEARNW